MDDDGSDWAHQMELERRRQEEDIDSEYAAFIRKTQNGRPWFYVVDQDENWIARVTK